MGVKERLIEFITGEQISIREFERRTQLSNGYVKGIKHSILPDKMRDIALQFPQLNTTWLMTGEGDMLKGVREANTDEPGREGCNCPFTSSMSEIIETMKSICDVNKKLVDQQSDLIAVIKVLSEKNN